MTAFIDFEDKTVDKAVEKACAELNVTKDRLKYDIISHGSSGIFGLVGAKKAMIRVTVPDGGKHDRRKEAAASDAAQVAALVDEAFGTVETEKPSVQPEPAPEPQREPAPRKKSKPRREPTARKERAPRRDSTSPRERTPRRESTPPVGSTVQEESTSENEPPPHVEPAPMDAAQRQAVADWVAGFVDQVIALISPDTTVSVELESNVCRFRIQGGDSARLIGKRGQTLDAVQYLVEKAVAKQFGTAPVVEIDVEGYLDKRRADLTALANRLAEKAQQSGKPMVINRINAQDRRVIHLSLKDNRHVRTQSVGNGDFRKLLILPKKKGTPKKAPDLNGSPDTNGTPEINGTSDKNGSESEPT